MGNRKLNAMKINFLSINLPSSGFTKPDVFQSKSASGTESTFEGCKTVEVVEVADVGFGSDADF